MVRRAAAGNLVGLGRRTRRSPDRPLSRMVRLPRPARPRYVTGTAALAEVDPDPGEAVDWLRREPENRP